MIVKNLSIWRHLSAYAQVIPVLFYLVILVLLSSLVSCSEKEKRNFELEVIEEVPLEITYEFTTDISTTYKFADKFFLSNVTNEVLVINAESLKIENKLTFSDFIVDDISTISFNEKTGDVFGHSEKKNAFLRMSDGEETMHPIDLSYYYIVDNRKTFGYFINESQMIFPLSQGDLAVFPNEMITKDLTTFAIYDFDQNKVIERFASYPDHILEAKGKYPKEFQVPFYLVNENHLLIGYPLGKDIIRIDLGDPSNVNYYEVSSENFRLPSPFKSKDDRNEVFKLFLYSNQFGPISYHKNLNLYSRVLTHELPLSAEKACQREYSLILFDEKFEVVGEISLDSIYVADWSFVLPTDDGFLVPGMCENYLGEDTFIYHTRVKIKQK